MIEQSKPICILFGAKGQVGSVLLERLVKDYIVHAFDRSSCDMTDAIKVAGLIKQISPHYIINAAAYTAVDRAENEPQLAYAINSESVSTIAAAASEINAHVIHYSTDYVFDGHGHSPWKETDNPAPLSVYGDSKLKGEQALARQLPRGHWIFRTSWVYGRNGANFLKTMLRLANERETLSVVDDQIGAPTSADLIVDVTLRALKAMPDPGTYHLSAAGETSWFGYARHVVDRARKSMADLRLAADAIQPISSANYPTQAKRPLNSRLDCEKLQVALKYKLPDWQDDVNRVVNELIEGQI